MSRKMSRKKRLNKGLNNEMLDAARTGDTQKIIIGLGENVIPTTRMVHVAAENDFDHLVIMFGLAGAKVPEKVFSRRLVVAEEMTRLKKENFPTGPKSAINWYHKVFCG